MSSPGAEEACVTSLATPRSWSQQPARANGTAVDLAVGRVIELSAPPTAGPARPGRHPCSLAFSSPVHGFHAPFGIAHPGGRSGRDGLIELRQIGSRQCDRQRTVFPEFSLFHDSVFRALRCTCGSAAAHRKGGYVLRANAARAAVAPVFIDGSCRAGRAEARTGRP